MIANQYRNLKTLVSQIKEILKQQCSVSDLQLQIKYSQLKVQPTAAYNSYLSESANSIVLLSDKPQNKKYRINADTTKQQYERIMQNCSKIKTSQKPQHYFRLDLKFGHEKINKIVGDQQWKMICKQQILSRQHNLIVDKKQFRLNFLQLESINEDAVFQIKKIDQKQLLANIKCMRFKDENIFPISPYYVVTTSLIYQSETEEDKLRFMKVFKKDDNEEMDSYIKNSLPKGNSKIAKYEAELKITEKGFLQMIKLLKNEDKLKQFLGDAMMNFRNLCKIDYKPPQDINELMNNLKI